MIAVGDFAFVTTDVPLEAIFCSNKHRRPTIRQAAEQGTAPDRLRPPTAYARSSLRLPAAAVRGLAAIWSGCIIVLPAFLNLQEQLKASVEPVEKPLR